MSKYSEHDLFEYAYCGPQTFFKKTLSDLANLAEREKWSTEGDNNLDILFYYILKTFERLDGQGKISIAEDGKAAVFNTGLLTENGEEIYGLMTPNDRNRAGSKNLKNEIQKWYFEGFFAKSSRNLMSYVFKSPLLATFFDDPRELYFDPDREIELSIDHVLDDHWDREGFFPAQLGELGKEMLLVLIKNGFDMGKVRLKRNTRLAVPQFYKGKLMFFIPVRIVLPKNSSITLALAVEPMENGKYRANTVFSTRDAYKKARLINKPESNWLI